MYICITRARGCLGDLIRRVQDGEDVILTRHGEAVVRLHCVKARAPASARGEAGAPVRATRGHKPGARRASTK